MNPIGPNVNQYEKSLNEFAEKSFQTRSENIDPAPGYCDQPPDNQYGAHQIPPSDWMDEALSNKKIGLGSENNCDPMQTGSITNDLRSPNRNTIYRYSKSIRATNEAVVDLFRNIQIEDEDGKMHAVPIIWATQERAVAAVVQDNVRKDETLVVDRIKLPIMAISAVGYNLDPSRYTYHKAVDYLRDARGRPGFTTSEKYENDTVFGVTRGLPLDVEYKLIAWTMHLGDMDQIVEQIYLKFSKVAYIQVRGVSWEVIVTLDSISDNLNTEPGDQALRIIKFEFGLTAKTYVAQPITRNKAVLKTKIDIVNSTKEEEISEVLTRIEDSVEELK